MLLPLPYISNLPFASHPLHYNPSSFFHPCLISYARNSLLLYKPTFLFYTLHISSILSFLSSLLWPAYSLYGQPPYYSPMCPYISRLQFSITLRFLFFVVSPPPPFRPYQPSNITLTFWMLQYPLSPFYYFSQTLLFVLLLCHPLNSCPLRTTSLPFNITLSVFAVPLYCSSLLLLTALQCLNPLFFVTRPSSSMYHHFFPLQYDFSALYTSIIILSTCILFLVSSLFLPHFSRY